MKKFLVLCLSSIVFMGVLVGCGSDNTASKGEDEKQSKTVNDTEKQASEDVSADKNEEKEDEEKADEENKEKPADVANAVDYTQALDPKKPVPLGTYMKLAISSVEDNKHHTVYAKLNKITSESEDAGYVKKVIDEHNAEAAEFNPINKEEMKLPDDIELNVLDYEVVIPKEFPAPKDGIPFSGLNIDFSAVNIDGGGIPNNDGGMVYLSLGTGETLYGKGDGDVLKSYKPGDTVKLRGYFPMTKGFDKYVIRVSTFPDGSDGSSGYKEAYFGIK